MANKTQKLECCVCGSTRWYRRQLPHEEQEIWTFLCRSCGHRRYFDTPLNKDDDGNVWVEEGEEP